MSRRPGAAERALAVVLGAGLLVFAALSAYHAPGGAWWNAIFGERVAPEVDPGGYYVAAAHEIGSPPPESDGSAPRWSGHPGTTLMLLLAGVQRAAFALGPSEGLTFTGFTARHLPAVFTASKLVIGVLHLAAAWLVMPFAYAVLRSRRAAFFAAAGYATSFPVLYALTRIAPEPILMICLAGAFLATWRFQDLARAQRPAHAEHPARAQQPTRALGFAALAGLCAGLGLMTKLNFTAPLPFLLVAYLLVGEWRPGSPDPVPRRTRVQGAAGFAVGYGAAVAACSPFVDWIELGRYWGWVALGLRLSTTGSIGHLAPSLEARSILLWAEASYVAAAVVGFVWWLRAGAGASTRALWIAVYAAWGLLLWVSRASAYGGFLAPHYFIPPALVLAVFFGHFTDRVASRFASAADGLRAAALGLAWLGLVHGLGVWAAIDARRHDARKFAARQPAHELVAALGPEQRLGIPVPPGEKLSKSIAPLQMVTPSWYPSPVVPVLRAEFSSSFVAVGPKQLRGSGTFVPALKREVVVVERERTSRATAPHTD